MKKQMMTLMAAGLCLCLAAACGSSKKETEAVTESQIEIETETEKATETQAPTTEAMTETEAPTETETEPVTEAETEKAKETQAPEQALEDGEALFTSEDMRFTFVYDEVNTVELTDVGAADLTVEGEDSLVNLSITVVPADSMPPVDQIIDDGILSETQQYLNNMAQPPEKDELKIGDHQLAGYTFSYVDADGQTVDSSFYVEKREGRGIYYRTQAAQDGGNSEAIQAALEKAVKTLRFMR